MALFFDIENGGNRRVDSMCFWPNSYVLCQILNIPTELGEDWFNSKEMATDVRYSRWRRPPAWFLLNMHFWYDICVWGQVLTVLNIPIKFG